MINDSLKWFKVNGTSNIDENHEEEGIAVYDGKWIGEKMLIYF
jgi:hypothetical protein